ncbi:MAG: hypothetical protein ACFNXE_04665, partial [Rothia dentocariosa]
PGGDPLRYWCARAWGHDSHRNSITSPFPHPRPRPDAWSQARRADNARPYSPLIPEPFEVR